MQRRSGSGGDEVPHVLPVPYQRQRYEFTCGPAAVMMALRHFDPRVKLDRTLELQLWREATLIFMTSGIGGCGPMGLAAAAAARGLVARVVIERAGTPFVSTVRSPAKRRVIEICHQAMRRRARSLGVRWRIAHVDLHAVERFVAIGALPIVLVDLHPLRGRREPHWVLVVGFDADHVIVHDPWLAAGEPVSVGRRRHIPREVFRRMHGYGTDVRNSMVVLAAPDMAPEVDRLMRKLIGPRARRTSGAKPSRHQRGRGSRAPTR